RCREMFQPKKFTLAGLEIWDPPGLPPGTAETDKEKRTRLLGALREIDAYVVVVRAFQTDSYPYDRPKPDPVGDLRRVVDELALADLVVAEGRIHKIRESLKRGLKSAEEDKK